MQHQWSNIPYDTLEAILICLQNCSEGVSPLDTSSSSQGSPELTKIRHSIRDCALVCREWVPVARYRLFKIQFLQGEVKVLQDDREVSALVDVLSSKVCTLGRSFVKALRVVGSDRLEARHDFLSKSAPHDSRLFLEALSAADRSTFPALETLVFDHVCPNPGGGLDHDDGEEDWMEVDDEDGDRGRDDIDDASTDLASRNQPGISNARSSTSILSQIKRLDIQTLGLGPLRFAYIAYTLLLCTSVEKLTIGGGLFKRGANEKYFRRRPPTTLRKLDLDSPGTVKWILSLEPRHTQISYVKQRRFNWPHVFDSDEMRYFFEEIGPHLEELELELATTVMTMDQNNRKPFVVKGDHVIPFLKNSSLKHLVVTAPFDMALGLLPYLFAHPKFAPGLETLEIMVYDVLKHHIPEVIKFSDLDRHLKSRPSFRRLKFSSSNGEVDEDDWKFLEAGVRGSMARCETVGKISTTYHKTGQKVKTSGARLGKPTSMMLGPPGSDPVMVTPIMLDAPPTRWSFQPGPFRGF